MQRIQRNIRRALIASLGAAVLFAGVAAQAADDPKNVIKYRRAVMSSIAAHITGIAAVVKGEVSFTGHLPAQARALHDMSLLIGDLFPPGTDVGVTRAKPEIWQQPEKFAAAIKALQTASAELLAAAESGDVNAVGAKLGPVGKACGGCHKPFRKPKTP